MKKIIFTCLLFILSVPLMAEDIKLGHFGGVFTVPIRLNGKLTMDFIVDSGAADVSLSDDITNRLLQTGIVDQNDIRGSKTYVLADGSSIKCRTLNLRAVRIGTREVTDVKASSCGGDAPLLLGQSFLQKLGQWSFDYDKNAIVLRSEPEKVFAPPTFAQSDLDWWTQAAERGNYLAQFNMGVMHLTGEDGVPKNLPKSFDWFMKSAEKGFDRAQYNVAVAYEQGNQGVAQNYAKAYEWYLKSAEQGNMMAEYNLSSLYMSGHGVPKDVNKAIEWCQKAAEKGYASAQQNLGSIYANELHNYPEALKWLTKAADQNLTTAKYSVGLVYSKMHELEKAAQWYKKAADNGYAEAEWSIGKYYELGLGVKKDMAQALSWYRKAAAQGHKEAIEDLKKLDAK